MGAEQHYLKEELDNLFLKDRSALEFLQRGSLDGLWYWDLDSPENEWMSPELWTTLGYDPSEMQHLASEWQDLIHPDDLAVALENFKRHCEDPSHPYDQVVRYRHRDGSTAWVRCRGMAIRDESGRPVRMLGAHTDLTSQKQAEERLQRNEGFLEAIFDAIQDGISVLDCDLNVLRVNETMKRWYAHEREIEGRKCYRVFHGRSEPCEICPAARSMKSGKLEVEEVPYTTDQGVDGMLELFSFPMVNAHGEVAGVVEYVRNITQRKNAEREREELIGKLQQALSEVKTLRGFLPICSSCKKIRDDSGYWKQIETYIRDHSEATFSHGICPECAEKLYPGLDIDS